MIRFTSIEQLRLWRDSQVGTVGFVPTMGALHEGHEALMKRAVQENAVAIASIFVNPTQFDDPKDLAAYPATLEKDISVLERAGVHAVFVPNAALMYPDGFQYEVREKKMSQILCGAHRPGHFTGMLTVVLKLLNLVQASRAYFGEKDFQQLKLIEGMAQAFFLRTEIIPCPTVRQNDGLAMSSRNQRLSPEQREHAPILRRILTNSNSVAAAKAALQEEGFDVDYVEEHWGRRLAAARLGNVRLIDNVDIST